MLKKRFKWAIVFAAAYPLLSAPVVPANLTNEAGAILTDAHHRVDKRVFVDMARHVLGDPCPGKIGDLLPEGAQVGTGDRSWAQISWTKVVTRIWEDSVVTIAPNRKIVYLLDGEMLFNLDKEHKLSENYEVWTKLLQARVRGTTFIAQSTADFDRIAVLEGSLDITNQIDHSVVHVGPGLVYEARSGAPPPATWLKQDNLNFDQLKKSKAGSAEPNDSRQPPFLSTYFDNSGNTPYSSYNPQYNQPDSSISSEPHKRFSDQEIEAKAQEYSKGDPSKLPEIRKYLQSKNPYLKPGEYPSGSAAPGSQPYAAGSSAYSPSTQGKVYSEAELDRKAQEFSKGDPVAKQHWLEKLHRMNPPLNPGQNYNQNCGNQSQNFSNQNCSHQPKDNGVRNYQPEPAVYTPIVPFVDTSEFAPIKAAKQMPRMKKGAFVDDLSSHAVPPLSLFRTTSTATNLYLADVNELWLNHLVQGFSNKLPSLPLVEAELKKLPSICRVETKFENSPQMISQRNQVFADEVKVIHGPDAKIYEVGKEMVNKLTLPGQNKSSKS